MNLFFLGDSLMQFNDKKTYPQQGWPQRFDKYLKKELGIRISNYAKNGRSTKSFIDEGIFKEALLVAKKGDICFISFGHNDEKSEDPSRYTSADGTYLDNLRYMYNSLKEKGVEVIFLTSISRLRYSNNRLVRTHGDYPHYMRELANELDALCIDLEDITFAQLRNHDYDYNKKYYMIFEKGRYENYPDGSEDRTHLCVTGADWISFIVYTKLKKSKYSYILK